MIPTGYETDALAEWHVFLAATNIYADEIGELKYAENDVDELVKIFSALGVKDENLIVLKSSNKDPYKTTSQRSIERNYKRFIDGLNSNSIAFVFLSGHGFTDTQNGGAYYAPLDFVYDYFDETKISIDDMMSQLADSSARFKWLCVDACRSNLAPTVKRRTDGKAKSLAIENVPKGVVFTQSCQKGQFSYEYGGSNAPFNNGLFTRAFVDAISGRSPEADVNPKDGVVTMGEIRDYIETRVPKDAQNYCNGLQNPVFTVKKGTSFDEIAPYKLFEDLPIYGHHPADWRRGQTLREEAEALLKEKKYDEALKKIQEAFRILPDVPEVTQLKDQIEKLFNENDVNQKADTAHRKAREALNAKKYDEARKLIGEALRLKPGNSTYEDFRLLVDAREKLETGSGGEKPETPPSPPVVNVDPPGSRKAGAIRKVTINGVEVVFRWCPPGGFKMGSPSNEEGRDDDETQHKVVITKGFWLAETETTQALWKAVMGEGNNPSYFKGDNLPVERVSRYDCQEFIKKLNEQAKSTGLVFRLPSEAHWEYACRAGTTTPFSFGSILNGDKANCNGNYPYGTNTKGKNVGKTTPVGSYSANAWGLKDMHGNVWEWCEDRHGDYPAGTVTDPTGPESGWDRVNRGGGWNDLARDCRSALRDGDAPEYRYSNLGFRLEGDSSTDSK